MSAAANKKLVQQVYTDSANRSGTTFVDNLAEDATWIVTGQYSWSHEFRGRDAINNGLMGHFRSFFAVRPRTVAFNFIAEGDYVVVEARGDNVTKSGDRASRTARSRRSRNIATPLWSSGCLGYFRQSEKSPPWSKRLSRVCAEGGPHRRPGLQTSSAFAVAASALALVRTWRERGRTRRQLAVMSARELQDIGTCWAEVANEAAKPFWQD
jgi:uncharacterized protein YjiS (DUF1127 family)/ketosteroid isomerase-like protein